MYLHPHDLPISGSSARYLATDCGFLRTCGWNLGVIGGEYRRFYGCVHAHKRGTCPNALTQPVDLVDRAFLAAVEQEALTPAQFRRALVYGVQHVRGQVAQQPDRRPALEQEQAALTRRIARIVEAIGDGRGPAALVQEIGKAEARIKEIEAEMARWRTAPALGDLDPKRIERDIARELARFDGLLRTDIPRARQALKQLLADRVEFTPMQTGDGRWTYRFQGELV
jgi:hypothetical protein